jgi:hypothetical protein
VSPAPEPPAEVATAAAPPQPPPSPPPAPEPEDDADETLLVISDPFARWDGTRWFIKTEVVVPFPMTFFAVQNYEFSVNAFQVRTILACEKDWKLRKTSWEVSCAVEDFAILASDDDLLRRETRRDAKKVTETEAERRQHIQQILDEVDARLTGASLQLQVADNGRVTNIDLEGVSKRNRREAGMHETLRLVLSRVIVGFDMRLQKWNSLQPGIWTEYSSKLMSMPVVINTGTSGDVTADTSMGTSMLVHRLARMDGHLVVESRGKGVISSMGANWKTEYSGVAVYDPDDGYMTERVWVLEGEPTSSTWLQRDYWHAGRIVQLDPGQKPSVGESKQVTMPCCPHQGIAPWVILED